MRNKVRGDLISMLLFVLLASVCSSILDKSTLSIFTLGDGIFLSHVKVYFYSICFVSLSMHIHELICEKLYISL